MEQSVESTSFGQRAERYWVESRRPLAGLLFVAPLLIIYETGVLFLGVHTGADTFMRRLLELLGLSQHFLLPILTVCTLLGWHYLSRQPWNLSGSILSAMAVESLLLGLCLWIFAIFGHAVFTLGIVSGIQNAIGFLGAGIYEELLFRLILLGLLAWAIRKAGLSARWSTVAAVAISSLLFAAAHYVGAHGDGFTWLSFLFRGFAGVFFAVIFLYRGFGIAAGSHAAYDIFVGVF